MKPREHLAVLLLGTVLLLPALGTTSRERNFCGAWLAQATPAKQQILKAAEQAEKDGPWDLACRAGLRPGLRRLLDAECRNWSPLMDFEVRLLVDRLLAPCGPPS